MPDRDGAVADPPPRRYVLLAASQSWWDYTILARDLADLHGGPGTGTVLLHGGQSRGPDEVAAAIWRAWDSTALGLRPDWAGPCQAGCPPGHRLPRGLLGTYCPGAGRRRDTEAIGRLVSYRAAGHPVCVLALLTPDSRRELHIASLAMSAALPLRIARTPARPGTPVPAPMEDPP